MQLKTLNKVQLKLKFTYCTEATLQKLYKKEVHQTIHLPFCKWILNLITEKPFTRKRKKEM